MPTETFHALALPHSVLPPVDDDAFHVSLFIAPRLVPDGGEQPLAEFELFVDWADRVAGSLEVSLEDQLGIIGGVRPLLHKVAPATWRALFPADETPVRANVVPDWQQRGWRSFDAGMVASIAKAIHLMTIASSLTDTPLPDRHFLGRLARRGGLTLDRYGDEPNPRDQEIEDTHPSVWLDRDPHGDRQRGLEDLVEQLHRARRFYERPEEKAQHPYQARPDEDVDYRPLPSPEPEFHARCAMAGDHPGLLRRLGLVVDLRVEDLDRLREASYLVPHVSVTDGGQAAMAQKVLCSATPDGAFTTVSASGDWQDGALRLGDEQRFTVIDVDADGSALKTERFLGLLPQLLDVQQNGDPASAATPALRAGGFTVARRHRAAFTEKRHDRQLQIASGARLDLHTEDVARGMRVEVWDDEQRTWRSLHARTSELVVGTGQGTVTEVFGDEGFSQGTSAGETADEAESKIHVHEALFGWEGWSLSVQRPVRRIRHVAADDPDIEHADRREVVEEAPTHRILDERPPHPILATHQVVPGSLPRLRFGRDYAFRAWAVDLAGNSRPHELAPTSPTDLAPTLAQLQELGEGPRDAFPSVTSGMRLLAHEALEEQRLAVPATEPSPELPPALGRLLRRRLADRAGTATAAVAAVVTRRTLLDRASAAAIGDAGQPAVTDTAVRSAARLAPMVTAHATAIGGVRESLAEGAVAALATVTKLRPFLRWDPVLGPTVVPHRTFTEGESSRIVVIRSGVAQDEESLAITVTDPEEYAAQASSVVAGLDYRAISSRHLAPPKTSQMLAELHGMFDAGIGSGDQAKHQAMLNWALAESGSLLDTKRQSLDDPNEELDQEGRQLVSQSMYSRPRTEELGPGDAPGPGQYVVHETDQLVLPYLPDPLAAGVSLVFPDAGLGRGIPAPESGEGFTARYGGTWPAIVPFRMDLVGSDTLGAEVKGHELTLRLPPADVQRFRLSSSLPADGPDLMGVWRSLPPALREDPDVAEAARDGWIWGLTPHEEVTLVHAVPRPLEAPRPTVLHADRAPGKTDAVLLGALDVHGPSTDSVVAEARWTDPVDELSQPAPDERATAAIGFQIRVAPEEDLLVLGDRDEPLGPAYGNLLSHRAAHEFGDTRHHRVTYTLRATTRFREYFHPELLAPAYDGDDGRSVVSAPLEVRIPSSARPMPPVVHSTIPLFRWNEGTEAEHPMAWRHERRSGVRIYLERPWFSSGAGELLGILLAPSHDLRGRGEVQSDVFGPTAPDQSGFPYVSKIGADPIWNHREVANRPLSFLHLDTLLRSDGSDDRPVPGRPVAVRTDVTVPVAGQPYPVTVAGYEPVFNPERRLWYVDVAIDPWASLGDHPKAAFWPFLRLAVARFQPDSIQNCHVSAPVRCDYVQLPPERVTSVSRTDERHVRVVVTGTRGWRSHPERGPDQNRFMVASLQRRDPQIPTDLGWITEDTAVLPVRGSTDGWDVAWMGELDAGKAISLRRPAPSAGKPSARSRWRVTVEEWERFRGDDLDGEHTWEKRLVYADAVLL